MFPADDDVKVCGMHFEEKLSQRNKYAYVNSAAADLLTRAETNAPHHFITLPTQYVVKIHT